MGLITKVFMLLSLLLLMPIGVMPWGQCDREHIIGNMTICIKSDGTAGICQYPYGVCCQEEDGCCPMGSKCNDGKCCSRVKLHQVGDSLFSLKEKIVCPNNRQCPDNFTCCAGLISGYGCCPLQDAVCCQDKIHCCPADTTCSLDSNICLQFAQVENIPGLEKLIGYHRAFSYA